MRRYRAKGRKGSSDLERDVTVCWQIREHSRYGKVEYIATGAHRHNFAEGILIPEVTVRSGLG